MSAPERPLQRYCLNAIHETGRTLGSGAYAEVVEYEFRGLICVGKKVHRLLYEEASPAEKAALLRRFEEECELLSQLHHPNIVQFLGIHMEQGSVLPVLVMECLPTGNLSGYLDKHGPLPNNTSYGILRDVALGLRYLHEHAPPIIHRDLSANNVLLTISLSAKISDLGVAKILNLSPSGMPHYMSTKAPGTPCYMPPEALMARPNYTIKIDSYSFGVLILHVFCGEWPFPTDTFQPDPKVEGGIIAVSEVDRRAEYLEQLGAVHPLLGLIHQCLNNVARHRPEAANILQQINTVMASMLCPLNNENHQLETEERKTHFIKEDKVDSPMKELQGLKVENESLRADNTMLTSTNNQLNSDIQQLRSEIHALKESVQEQPSEPICQSVTTTSHPSKVNKAYMQLATLTCSQKCFI